MDMDAVVASALSGLSLPGGKLVFVFYQSDKGRGTEAGI